MDQFIIAVILHVTISQVHMGTSHMENNFYKSGMCLHPDSCKNFVIYNIN